MIKYNLVCKDCSANFDSWFATSKEYEKVKKMQLLICENCSSKNIDKSLMAPNVFNTKKDDLSKNKDKYHEVKKKLREYKNFVKKNFEYVGENFSYEARSIHYGNKKSKRGIYGNVSSEDIKELKDEGIETTTIPWINDEQN